MTDGHSLNQPVAPKRICEFTEYPGVVGPAMSAMMDMRDISSYFAVDPKNKDSVHYISWDSDGPSKYVPMRVTNYDDAKKAIDDFSFPNEWKREINRASQYLVGSFEKITSPITLRDLDHGRMDSRKLSKVVEATKMGDYNAQRILPFKKTLPAPSKVPTIAIVADGNFGHMWQDAEFIPRMVQLATAVLYACESVGMACYAAITAGHDTLRDTRYKEAIWAIQFATPNRIIPVKRYASLLHRDMYRHALISAEECDRNCHVMFQTLEGTTDKCGSTWGARQGGYAVNWARTILGADAVVSIGNILDADKAEVRLGYKFTIDEAIKEVAKQAHKLRGEE